MRIFGVILAGGAGLRMGADKALMPLGGQPLIAWVAERLSPQVEALAISANGDPARFFPLGLPVLPDAAALGPLAGILAALKWAGPLGATAVVSCPCDSPFLPPDLVPRLCLAAERGGVSFAVSGQDQHPTHALWPVGLSAALESFLASGAVPRVGEFAMQHGAGHASFPPGSFANANSPQDLAQLEARVRGGRDAL